MKKSFLLLIFVFLLNACSSNTVKSTEEAKVPVKAQFVNNGYNIEVHIPEDVSDIVFTINNSGELKINVEAKDKVAFERLLISDGEHYLRVRAAEDGKFVLKGRALKTFRAIVDGNKDVTLKGRVSNYNYYVQNIAAEDIRVVGRIFEEKTKNDNVL